MLNPLNSVQQKEADIIFSLLIYSLVYKDWQHESVERSSRRGYNIGALLVNKENDPVFYGLNCIDSTNNATQHGEVRAITGFLEKNRCFNLEGFTVYTTLEPCIMCAGMMTMTAVNKVVYGMNDVEYSKAFERLSVDTRSVGGYPPYPRKVLSQPSETAFTRRLDEAYKTYLEINSEKILARFLNSETARIIYKEAYQDFVDYNPQHPESKPIYQKAIEFLNTPPHEHQQQQ